LQLIINRASRQARVSPQTKSPELTAHTTWTFTEDNEILVYHIISEFGKLMEPFMWVSDPTST